ncbi:MAG: DUF2974 domain-containing protein [Stomatobaculum sp.]|nr:DUF2974 domain-containing protein [Stomatobaculum sp.]
MALTTEQVLLLNNLMYMSGDGDPLYAASAYEGQTIESWLNSIDTNSLVSDKNYGSYMNGDDWNNIIEAVKSDDTLMNMTVKTTHTDWDTGGGGGYSAVFVSENSGEAVVAFRGTASNEWKDNFTGGNVTDTAQQKNALSWYKEVYEEYGLDSYDVTVTGHSKGGNKSKYIALLDDTVDHCVSFDGQGFSDKFMAQYKDQIAARQNVIENHNVDYDYVNLLLNDVGETTFYKGQDLGEGGFLENHCPNTFMKFGEGGSFEMVVNPEGQGKEMQALDQFLNSYLRSLSDSERNGALELVNALIDDAFSMDDDMSMQDKLDVFMKTVADPGRKDDIARLLAYAIKYEQENPELAKEIKSVLNKFGMDGAVEYIDLAHEVLNFEINEKIGPFTIHLTFDDILAIATGAAGAADKLMEWLSKIPGVDKDWIFNKLAEYIKDKCGIELTADQLRALLGILQQVSDDLDDVKIHKDGSDITVDSPAVLPPGSTGAVIGVTAAGNHRIFVKPQEIRAAAKLLETAAGMLSGARDDVQFQNANLRFKIACMKRIRERLKETEESLQLLSTRARSLSEALTEIAVLCENTENQNTGMLDPEHL